MDFVTALGGIGAAFGLATSAGLNAYIPLLIVALVARFTDLIRLAEPYDLLTSWWVIGLLGVLLVVEMLVDKVPAIDSANDIVQTFIRPAAGAILFAANAGVINDISPVVALVAGLLLAGTVHTTKVAARPVVTATTAGMGNWFVSLLEDIAATIMSLLSVIVPILMLFASVLLVYLVVRLWRRRKRPAYAEA
ncbi:MAG: DUF4126 domain-containing protein [Anaerolineales bacterium]|nr:DUF4126 domain-containing protein [Anaerolineales bacterium]MCB8951186.1 DUF4126 domain-containing protein [Ardenticatenales bacterium]